MTTPTIEAQQTSVASPPASVASVAAPAASTMMDSVTTSVAATPAVVVPDTYDLKLAPTVKGVDAAIVERTAAIARVQGLGNEAAQKLLDSTVAEITAQQTAQAEAWKPGGAEWTRRDTEWRQAAMADADIGGTPEKLAKSVELAQQVMAKFGGPETVAFLKETGLGSHPAALKLLARIGASMSESSLVVGHSSTPGGSKSAAEKLYGPDGTGKPKSE